MLIRLFLFCFMVIATQATVCIPGGVRVPCCHNCSQSTCESSGCCWGVLTNANGPLTHIPSCYNPNSPIQGYEVTSFSHGAQKTTLQLSLLQGIDDTYGPDIHSLICEIIYETDVHVRIKIFDANETNNWEIPSEAFSPTNLSPSTVETAHYIVSFISSPFGFSVTRKFDSRVIFNTSSLWYTSSESTATNHVFNGLIYKPQYLEISTQTPIDPNLYGLGERAHPLRLSTSSKIYTLWARDIQTPPDVNLYSSHPFYMELRNSSAHGVFIRNSNGMDIYVGEGRVTFRIIGGILDFSIFIGPSPDDVVKQYTDVIGKPMMPPYWSLGFHQSRWGYDSLTTLKQVVDNYNSHQIPLETIWSDIDYMSNYEDFTWDPVRFPVKDVQKFVAWLHSNEQKYVVIIDPGIKNMSDYRPFELGQQMDIFIKDIYGNPLIGQVWPNYTVYPDFPQHPLVHVYWETLLSEFLSSVPIDGLWIDMNEPANFCDGECLLTSSPEPSNYDSPPYTISNNGIGEPLNTHTISMSAVHYGDVLEYFVHNLFGHFEAKITASILNKLQKKRHFLLTRSSFPGTGTYAAKWLGDNKATWRDLYLSIPGMLNFQLFGIPMIGADICGFAGNTTMDLCARWIQLGAFSPFSRNHNHIGAAPQELYRWPEVTAAAIKVLSARYSLLPYYYTLFYEAHKNGTPVLRPLFFDFSTFGNKEILSLDTQFLVGKAIMVSPVLQSGATSVDVYFPPGQWYDFWTFHLISSSQIPQKIKLGTPLDHIQVHLRGGHIVPLQRPALTTAQHRVTPWTIIVALNCEQSTNPTKICTAQGDLFVDDGSSFISDDNFLYAQFQAYDNQVVGKSITVTNKLSTVSLSVEKFVILGISEPARVFIGNLTHTDWKWAENVLSVYNPNVLVGDWVVSWNFDGSIFPATSTDANFVVLVILAVVLAVLVLLFLIKFREKIAGVCSEVCSSKHDESTFNKLDEDDIRLSDSSSEEVGAGF